MELVPKKEVKTEVDALLELVIRRKEISFDDASKVLGIPFKTVESLAGFLEQENLLGIKYKLTTPYIIAVDKQPVAQNKADEFLNKLKREEGLIHIVEEMAGYVNDGNYVATNASVVKLQSNIVGMPREKREKHSEKVNKIKLLVEHLKEKIAARFDNHEEKKVALVKIVDEIKENVTDIEGATLAKSKEEEKELVEKKGPLKRMLPKKKQKGS